jgi:hypothetical protein
MWVRPVPANGGPVPLSLVQQFAGRELSVLDVVTMDLAPPNFGTKYQCENRVILSPSWQIVGRMRAADLLCYCATGTAVLHGCSKVEDPSALERLPPQGWSSLELRHVKDAKFSLAPRKQDRWVVDFTTGTPFPTHLCLKVTDPVVTGFLNKGKQVGPECLVTLSLAEPIAYPQFNLPELCYKLVAAVIDVRR